MFVEMEALKDIPMKMYSNIHLLLCYTILAEFYFYNFSSLWQTQHLPWDGIHESTISLMFLGIIVRFLRLKVSTLDFAFLQSAICT